MHLYEYMHIPGMEHILPETFAEIRVYNLMQSFLGDTENFDLYAL